MGNCHSFLLKTAQDTIAFGEKLGAYIKKGMVFALKGTIGAGKTTLVQGIAKGLGIDDAITSPTYTLISEYPGELPLYHMDLYRIDSLEEFELLGAEEFIYGDGVSFIEWSEIAEAILPDDLVTIKIVIKEDNVRELFLYNLDIPEFS